jgi:hypothetical protein
MFEHYLAALFGLRQMQDLAYSALPDAPVLPDRGDRGAKRDRRSGEPASPAGTAEAADGSSKRDLCPCRQRGATRDDRHGCVAMCKELFSQLDQELDAWEAAYGWLYRV